MIRFIVGSAICVLSLGFMVASINTKGRVSAGAGVASLACLLASVAVIN